MLRLESPDGTPFDLIGALRQMEQAVELLAKDLQTDTDGFGRILVRKSKTDQTGEGAYVAITSDARSTD